MTNTTSPESHSGISVFADNVLGFLYRGSKWQSVRNCCRAMHRGIIQYNLSSVFRCLPL